MRFAEIQTPHPAEQSLRRALEERGQRYTAQRAAVYRFLHGTDCHPTAEEVFRGVRTELPGISLATVYKSLETLVGCGLAVKLTYADDSARYDGRTDPHHHARCLACDCVVDIPGMIPETDLEGALVVAERIRSLAEQSTATPPITVSVGVAAYRGGDIAPDELIALADRAAYRAKFSGRNTVAVPPSGDPVHEAERVLLDAIGGGT